MTKLSFTITLHDKNNYLYDRNILHDKNIYKTNFYIYMTNDKITKLIICLHGNKIRSF